jgi:ABC-type hemin transport system ATPase subunit
MELLASLCHQHGRTLLVVLHDLNLAAAYADELVLMREGRIRYRGVPLDVFHQQALDDVFGLRAQVMVDPVNGRPFCVPIKGKRQDTSVAAETSTETIVTL